MKRSLAGFLLAMVMCMTIAATAPTLAGSESDETTMSASGSANADMVDGKHAVGWKKDPAARAGKLVATNRRGYLPGNIIAKAQDADRLDGFDSSAFVRRDQIDVLTVVGSAPLVSAHEIEHPTATCPDGYVVTGGGWGLGHPTLFVKGSFPVDDRTWMLSVDNANFLDLIGQRARAYAVCVRFGPSSPAQASTRGSTQNPAGAPAPEVAGGLNADTVDGRHAVGPRQDPAARAGKLVATSKQGYLPDNIVRKAKNADTLDGYDKRDLARIRTVLVTKQVGVPMESEVLDITCPPGSVVTAGGYARPGQPLHNPDQKYDPLVRVIRSHPETDRVWRLILAGGDSQRLAGKTLVGYATCMYW